MDTNDKSFTPAPIKPTISYKEFQKLDIRVGTIELVEDVEKSDKLVRLTVDFGDHKRNILVGLKQEREDPKAEIEGKQTLDFIGNNFMQTKKVIPFAAKISQTK